MKRRQRFTMRRRADRCTCRTRSRPTASWVGRVTRSLAGGSMRGSCRRCRSAAEPARATAARWPTVSLAPRVLVHSVLAQRTPKLKARSIGSLPPRLLARTQSGRVTSEDPTTESPGLHEVRQPWPSSTGQWPPAEQVAHRGRSHVRKHRRGGRVCVCVLLLVHSSRDSGSPRVPDATSFSRPERRLGCATSCEARTLPIRGLAILLCLRTPRPTSGRTVRKPYVPRTVGQCKSTRVARVGFAPGARCVTGTTAP